MFARARQLVVNGNGAAGRVLVDSVIAATSPDSPIYADAIYWRAALAATSADAERDYKRLVVEYPLSAHAGDALFQLAQLEVARGDRAAATTHLDRFLLENPASDDRGRAGLMLVRLAFDQNEPQHALRGASARAAGCARDRGRAAQSAGLLLAALCECRQHAGGCNGAGRGVARQCAS